MVFRTLTVLNKAIKTEPVSKTNIKKLIAKIYQEHFRLYVKILTWKRYRKEPAPIRPFKLIWIDPKDVKFELNKTAFDNWLIPQITEAPWENKRRKFKDNMAHNAFKSYFEEEKDWQDTYLYEERQSRGENVEKRTKNMELLYKNIKKNGYKTQKKLENYTESTSHTGTINRFLDIFNEVTVSIGPKGEFYLNAGQHRLSIAKILEIDKIPVRVLLRHREWQDKRNDAVKNPEKLSNSLLKHPDIEYLLG